MKLLKINTSVLFLFTTLLLVPSLLYAKAEDKITETYKMDRDGKVYLENVSGNIVVKSWNKNEIEIIATKVARNNDDLENVSVDITHTDDNVRITTRHLRTRNWFGSYSGASVHYSLRIPDKARLRVKSVSGDIELHHIGGALDAGSTSGKIEIMTAEDGVKAGTVSGEIYMENITGRADIKSTSGEIKVKGGKGSIEANVVSGDIELTDVSLAEEIEASSISGDIDLECEFLPGGDYEFHTISGEVNIKLPGNSDFDLRTKTMSGGIDCDFEIRISGKIERKKLQGTVGKGGASLEISTLSGDINLEKK